MKSRAPTAQNSMDWRIVSSRGDRRSLPDGLLLYADGSGDASRKGGGQRGRLSDPVVLLHARDSGIAADTAPVSPGSKAMVHFMQLLQGFRHAFPAQTRSLSMYHHVKKLMYTVHVGEADPRFGRMLLEQFG